MRRNGWKGSSGKHINSPAEQLSGSCVAVFNGHSFCSLACAIELFVVGSEKEKFVDEVDAAVSGRDVQGSVLG